MADRRAHREGVATRLLVFARSLILLGVVAVGVPALLVYAARERFGGASPLHGVASPVEWDGGRIRSALTDRLTDDTIADIVIRLSLIVAWVAVGVLVLSVIAEVVHMLRHDGLAMPDVRGLGPSQRTARMIASGLLVIVPLFTSPTTAVGRESPLVPDPVAAAPVAAVSVADEVAIGPTSGQADRHVAGRLGGPMPRVDSVAKSDVAASSGHYVVQAGDSVFGIAERLVGPDSASVAAFAEQLVDVNLGRRMPDGRHFTNAAFIDVGW
ncbi:hypothetical protein, partial [Ilumatobacter sp.]|uniref:hypothetical protein n=1 Tax=Ilumatobacter sp. TaxID=1967498 RepID=UPI003AF71927